MTECIIINKCCLAPIKIAVVTENWHSATQISDALNLHQYQHLKVFRRLRNCREERARSYWRRDKGSSTYAKLLDCILKERVWGTAIRAEDNCLLSYLLSHTYSNTYIYTSIHIIHTYIHIYQHTGLHTYIHIYLTINCIILLFLDWLINSHDF